MQDYNYNNQQYADEAPMMPGGGDVGYPAAGYGGVDDAPYALKKPFFVARRRKMNIVAISINLFVPWLLNLVVFGFMSFSVRHKEPYITCLVDALGLLVVLGIGIHALITVKRRRSGDIEREPTWLIFLFVTSLLAWTLAMLVGDWNYKAHNAPFYDTASLNTYPQVDPAKHRGSQLMDAGRIFFSPDTRLALSKSMGFKNHDQYCVVPITSGNATLATYDFWAVGTNCCNGQANDFHCGEFNNPRARAGLRLMNDGQRAFYRLAVQQAEATYDIKAVHPLFFHWMKDPVGEMQKLQEAGVKFFLLGMVGYFFLQLFLVVVACIAFSKLGTS